nr:MAG TPA: hypothetical protein [Caudoviricetes sp.]
MSQKRLIYWLFALFTTFLSFKNIYLFLYLLMCYTTDKLQIFYNKSRPKYNRTAYFMPAI